MAPAPVTSSVNRLETLSAELRQDPNDVGILNEIGHENARLTQWDLSTGAYREALLVEPNNKEARMGYVRGLLAMGD